MLLSKTEGDAVKYKYYSSPFTPVLCGWRNCTLLSAMISRLDVSNLSSCKMYILQKMFLVGSNFHYLLMIWFCFNYLCGLPILRDLRQYNRIFYYLIFTNCYRVIYSLLFLIILDKFLFVTNTKKGKIKCSFTRVLSHFK